MNKLKLLILTFLLATSATTFAQTFTANFDSNTGSITDNSTVADCFNVRVTGVGVLNALNTSSALLKSVTLHLQHQLISDLKITLKAPDGTSILLFSDGDGTFPGTTFSGTVFTDTASNFIVSGSDPYTGYFQLNTGDSIANFNHLNINADGIWSICILDGGPGAVGFIDSFSLHFQPAPVISIDEPCNTRMLTVGYTCIPETFTNATATNSDSSLIPAPGCASYNGGDVWFSAIVPAEGAMRIEMISDASTVITDGGMAIYSGHCDHLQLIECDDDDGANLMPLISAFNLTPGDTIWIRVWEYGNDNPGTFKICATIPPPPPANDEPCNAAMLNVVPAGQCVYQNFTNTNATATNNVPDPGCGYYVGGDVWFMSIVPAGGAVRFDMTADTMTDGGMAVYTDSGSCNYIRTLVACDDNSGVDLMPQITLGGLNPGDTLWVRVWDYGNTLNGNFGICASIPPPPPVNDEPCNAVELTVTNNCTYQTYTNTNATTSGNIPAPACALFSGNDVWFRAIVPAGGAIRFDTQADSMTDGGMAVYKDTLGSCSNLRLITCDDNTGSGSMPQITLSGLTPGDTLWVRVWSYGNFGNGSFGICASVPPPAPLNDNPCNATPLTPSTTCTYTTYTTTDATGSINVPAPGCASYSGGDVWFRVIVPDTGATLIFDTQAGSLTDGGMAIYSGPCDNLTLIDCDDDGSGNLMPQITAPNLTPGDTIWVRVWEYSNDNPGTFGICVTTTPSSNTPTCGNNTPAGNTCEVAPDVCNFNGYCGNTSAAYTADYWNELNREFSNCLRGASIENNSFVAFVASSTSATFDVYVTSSLRGNGIQMFFYEGSCGGPVTCHGGYNSMRMRAAPWVVTATNLTPGNTYYLMFDGYAGDVCDYLISPVNGVDIVTVNPTAPAICKGGNVTLTVSGGTGPYVWTGQGGTAPVGLSASGGTTVIASPDTTTTYFVEASSTSTVNSCPIKVKVTVKVNKSPVAPIVGNALEYCKGAVSVPLTATPLTNHTLNWYTDSTNGTALPAAPSPSTANSGTTTYYVSQTNTLGCESPRSFIPVSIKSSFSVEVGGPFDVFNGQSVQSNPVLTGITTAQLTSILWTPSLGVSATNILNPTFTPAILNGQASYYLTITDPLGCTFKDTLLINVINKCLLIKNAFSPNGDGLNDFWQVYNTRDCVKKISVNVFNRNGSKVYETDDYFNDWNGQYNGKKLPDGTYYAVINVIFLDGKKVTTKTDLTILR